MKTSILFGCALLAASSVCLAADAPGMAASGATMSKADYKAAKSKVEADYKAAKKACKPMKGAEEKACMKQAKADHAKAEADIKAAKK